MKKIILIGALLIVGVYGIYQYQTPQLEISDAKLSKTYKDVHDLDIQNPLIVIGKKTTETPIIKKDEQGVPDYAVSVSEFEISKVIKNKTKEKVDKGSTIKIMETGAWDKETDTIYSIEGYKLMESGQEYLLFLNENESKEDTPLHGSYNIAGVIFGKYLYEKNGNVNYGKDLKNYKNEYKEKIKEIYAQLPKKYTQFYTDN